MSPGPVYSFNATYPVGAAARRCVADRCAAQTVSTAGLFTQFVLNSFDRYGNVLAPDRHS